MTKAQIKTLKVEVDPTEQNMFAIRYLYEYEPHEFCSVWLAREMTKEVAEEIVGLFMKKSHWMEE